MRYWPLLLLAAAGAGCERDPMARTDDLWPGLRRARATVFPTSEEIAKACVASILYFKQEAEKTPGTYVDIEYDDFFVRNPQCRWEQGSASTALCRFELTSLSMGQPEEERRESLAYLKRRPWDRHQARMVFVEQRGPGWIVPEGCPPIPKSDPSSG